METLKELLVFCIYCRAQKEERVMQHICQLWNEDVEVFIPKKMIEERKSGKTQLVEKPLTRGYAFLFTKNSSLKIGELANIENVLRILSYGDGNYLLQGQDRDYAMWLYQNQGLIDISDVLVEGKAVIVASGPLLSFEGKIIKLDKRKKRALVLFSFDGVEREISLGINILDQI